MCGLPEIRIDRASGYQDVQTVTTERACAADGSWNQVKE